MKNLTNLELAAVAVGAVLAFVFLALSSELSLQQRLYLVMAIIVIGLLVGTTANSLRRVLDEKSIWLQPPSRTAKTILLTAIPFLFLSSVAFVAYIFLEEKGSKKTVLWLIIFLIASFAGGRYLRKYFPSNPLLPYAVSVIGALVMVLIILAVAGT
jgi:cyanate permease